MKEVFSQILTNFSEYSSIEAEPKSESNSILITLKGDGKTKNKHTSIYNKHISIYNKHTSINNKHTSI